MKMFTTIFLMTALISQTNAAPQFITFKEGKIGVNFGGYHASAGLGGLLGGGTGGGLFAEAGTPYGQSARAGLAGGVNADGGSAGGLYAGATAGGNIKAETGLGGGVIAEKSAGVGFASAQAGDRFASSGLGGESGVEGSSGFTFSGTKSFGLTKGVVKETEVLPAHPVESVKHKKVYSTVSVDTDNEIKPLPLSPPSEIKTEVAADFNVNAEAQPAVLVKEVSKIWGQHGKYYRNNPYHFQDVMNSVFGVPSGPPARFSHRSWQRPQYVHYMFPEVYVQPPPPKVIHKEIIRTHYKPHRHHFRKTAYVGGYIGGDVAPPAPVVYKSVQPVIEKRIDVGAESAINAGAAAHADVEAGGGGQYGFTKQVTYQRNPTFFADIFNIPISTLKAVGNFLGNTAGSTSVSVQKSASVHAADSDLESSKHVPLSSATSGASDTHISVQTPPVSKFIDDIFSIPINTLGAVNKFLENNVQGRKTVQISQDEEQPTKVRLGPHARRRANKRVVILQENPETTITESEVKHSE